MYSTQTVSTSARTMTWPTPSSACPTPARTSRRWACWRGWAEQRLRDDNDGRRERQSCLKFQWQWETKHSRVQVFISITYRRPVSSLSQTASLIYNKGPSQEMCCLSLCKLDLQSSCFTSTLADMRAHTAISLIFCFYVFKERVCALHLYLAFDTVCNFAVVYPFS